jgi:hypothetical protein
MREKEEECKETLNLHSTNSETSMTIQTMPDVWDCWTFDMDVDMQVFVDTGYCLGEVCREVQFLPEGQGHHMTR